MKIEIELDPSKIDYDSINKQIAEKVAAMKIEDSVDIKGRIDKRIEDTIKEMIINAYSAYIEKYDYGTYPTAEGKQVIDKKIRDELDRVANEAFSIIEEKYNFEKELTEIALKYLPSVFVSVLRDRVKSDIYSFEDNYTEMIRQAMINDMENRINHIKYNL